MKEERRELDHIPFDRYGMKATGFEVLIDGVWWNEFEDEDGEVFYFN